MLKGFVDRIEAEIAVIQIDDFGPIELPVQGLPDTIREGMVVSIQIVPDPDETSQRENDIADIQDRLRNRG